MFKGYDVRGVYGEEVTEKRFFALGRALDALGGSIVLGMDYRKPNASLAAALADGFGGEKIFLGIVPTPAIAFHSKKFGASITASHNPPPYVGAKPLKDKRIFYSHELSELKKLFEEEEARARVSRRSIEFKQIALSPQQDLVQDYVEALPAFHRGLFDLGGGAACALARVFPQTIFSEPDPAFKKHAPEPNDETLSVLKQKTLSARVVGFAFDGDADRLACVDRGRAIDGGVLGAFIASRELSKGDGVVLSIDCSDEVREFLEDEGFKVFVSPVGDSNVCRIAEEKNAAFSIERSGHYAFSNHMLYSDALHVAATISDSRAGEVFDFAKRFRNKTLVTQEPVRVDFAKFIELVKEARQRPLAIETIDGVKARFAEFVFLVRASQTEPKTRINVEARTNAAAEKGLRLARELLKKSLL